MASFNTEISISRPLYDYLKSIGVDASVIKETHTWASLDFTKLGSTSLTYVQWASFLGLDTIHEIVLRVLRERDRLLTGPDFPLDSWRTVQHSVVALLQGAETVNPEWQPPLNRILTRYGIDTYVRPSFRLACEITV